MRLKAIELQGFKSFPDKTRITFDSGVTAIIGPNGSGKSNISDAIRWVLGEMSVKSLRGSRMEDVIFNGTYQKPAANSASVSLCIDTEEEYNLANHVTFEVPEENETGEDGVSVKKNAVYRLSDEPEVTVTRKYYRTGESEYYINKKQVRLKDIYELFYDTGIGREGYSVIGQGKIAEVLSQKDDERRSIFEEAAGISKFRYKKLEAERKLRDTENNLVRINDILSEITARIVPLEKEAENAKKYLVLNEEKKGLEITLWLDQISDLRARRIECEASLAASKLALDNAENEVAECDAATDRMLNENYESARLMAECESRRSEASARKSDAESRKAVCANDIAHANEALTGAKAAVEAAKAELSEAENAVASLGEARKDAEKALDGAGEKCIKAEKAYDEIRAEVALFSDENDRSRGALDVLSAQRSEFAARMAASEAGLAAAKQTGSENLDRINAGKERIKALGEERDKIAGELYTAKNEAGAIQSRIDGYDFDSRELESRRDTLNADITAAKIDLSALEQKHDQLVRFERLLEGYSDSVKCVVNDVAAGKITDNGRRFSIYGTVSNIVSSDSEYVLALETALAAAVQFIVVDKESDAKACIRYLKENRLGRATFLPVESVSGRIADVSAVKDMPGYIGVASSLAKYDKKFEGVVNDLLGRTVIADNIENASAIARKTGFRVKTVTLDGQVINPGGSYTGGSSAGKVGIFTRARDIERLAGEIKKCREKTDSLVKELETVEEKIKETASLRAKAVEELNAKTAECAGLSDKIRAFEVRIDEENTHISSLADPREIIAGLEAAMSSLREELAKIDEAIASANAACASAKESLDGAKLREEAALQEVTAARMELYSRKNELSLAGERLASGSERENAIKARIKLYEDSSAKAEQTIAERIAETALLAAESSECDSEIAQFTERLASLMAGREEKEKELNEMRARQKKASAARDEAFRRFTADESKRNSVNASYDNVTSKLWEEYELTYSDAEKYRLPKEQMDKAPSRLASIKSKIKAMGTINVNAVEEYRVTKERYDFLTAQTDDLNKTRQQLDRTIDKLAVSMKTTFLEYFDKINIEFNAVFNELFGGGSARAELTDPEDPLGCGIEIILKVPGKSVRNISLLSGGEQSFAAISLYLALQRVNPAPFCVFDEIESALDEVNIVKFASFVRKNSDKTQYIIITHRRGTMEHADTLYGITMHQKGISDYMRLNMAKLDDRFKENIN